MATLETILANFGFATVIEPTFIVGESGDKTFTLDSLRVTNLTQEGPTREAKGGLYNNTQMRYGKTVRLEMEDVIGRIEVLEHLMGAKLNETKDILWITDKFPAAVRIEGKTFVLDRETGEKHWVEIIIPKFLPDATFEMNLEAEGDFGVFNIAGEVQADKCGKFYAIRALGATGEDDCYED